MIVKNKLSIFLLIIYLFSFTELSQLLKLPMLVKHFIEHTKSDPVMTFSTFIKLHYLNGSSKDADYEKDMKLPFKSVDNLSFITFTFENTSEVINLQTFESEKISSETPSHYVFSSSFCYLDAIWQPPQFC